MSLGLSEVRAARRDPRYAVLEGFHAVKHAVRFGAEILGCWAPDPDAITSLAAALAPDITLAPTAADISAVAPRAEVVAVARRPALTGPRPSGHVVLLEDPRRLNNVGAAIRVAAAAGAAGVLTTGTVDPWHPDALRGSAGLHFALPVQRIEAIDTGDRPLVALDPEGDRLGTVELPDAAILAFGTERHGLSDALLARAEHRVALAMAPGVSSLNLATAVAATLYVLAGAGPTDQHQQRGA